MCDNGDTGLARIGNAVSSALGYSSGSGGSCGMRESGGCTVAGHLHGRRFVFHAQRVHLGDLHSPEIEFLEDPKIFPLSSKGRTISQDQEGAGRGGEAAVCCQVRAAVLVSPSAVPNPIL